MQKNFNHAIPMYNLIEYSHNSLQFCYNNRNITKFSGNSASFESIVEIIAKKPAKGTTRDVIISVPLMRLSSFWSTLET